MVKSHEAKPSAILPLYRKVVGHNARCHQIYEEAVLKFYNEKKWTCHQVA